MMNAHVDSIIGQPYRSGAKAAHGYDCVSMVVSYITKATGRVVAVPNYKEGDPATKAIRYLGRIAQRVPVETALPGDVVLFVGHQCHMGIMTTEGIVHACARRGKVVLIPTKAIGQHRAFTLSHAYRIANVKQV